MKIEHITAALEKKQIESEHLQEFGLLIPLFYSNQELHILFEIRSQNLKNQPGEICLPGGRIEPGESPVQAALRETFEELGINQESISILGKSEPVITPFNYALYPYVGLINPFQYPDTLNINTDEVDSTFSVPLKWFLVTDPENYPIHSHFDFPADFPYQRIQNGKDYAWKTASYPVYFYQYKEHVIWGMTAKIMHTFCTILNNSN